jgi:hypothetical protein
MAAGLQVWDASGNIILDTSDQTFRYIGSYGFTVSSSDNSSTVVSVPGVSPGTHFATSSIGLPVVETNQVRVYGQIGSSGSGTFYVFRI